MRRILWVGACVCVAVQLAAANVTAPRIVPIGVMTVERAAHQATRLNDGKVLITGGCGTGCESIYDSAETFDPQRRTFRQQASMTIPRASHSATLLRDGRVLIAGGWTGSASTATAEVFDPALGRFVRTASMSVARIHPVATLLEDGRVLITGGELRTGSSVADAEIYNPRSGRFTAVSAMREPRMNHSAVLLPDGRVLVAGGHRARGDLVRSAELFDPKVGRFTQAGELRVPRHKHAAVLLSDGRVLVVGGSSASDLGGRYDSTEFYDPATDRFTPGQDCCPYATRFPAVVALSSGNVLVLGGARNAEILRRGASEFVSIDDPLPADLMFAAAAPISARAVLLVGGYDSHIRAYDEAMIATVN